MKPNYPNASVTDDWMIPPHIIEAARQVRAT